MSTLSRMPSLDWHLGKVQFVIDLQATSSLVGLMGSYWQFSVESLPKGAILSLLPCPNI